MTFEDIVRHVGTVPHMPPDRGKLIYEFIRTIRPEAVLELGFAHGTSSCYIAAAMEANGKGKLLTIDHKRALDREPNISALLEKTGLDSFVEARFCERSYTWELLKLLEAHTREGRTEPAFEFVFIDGGHTWDSDGFSFLLADRLLKPNGWILFDDVLWTPSMMEGEAWVREMPEEERDVAHVEKILSLLVIPDGKYHNMEFDGTWAWVQKKGDQTSLEDRSDLVKKMYAHTKSSRSAYLFRRYLKRLFRLS